MKTYGTMEIYKPSFGDCSNRGISSRFNTVQVVDADKTDINELKDNDIIIKEVEHFGKTYLNAYDAKLYLSGHHLMFGGCAVYTSNGIVPHSGEFIKLFDRYEANSYSD